MRKFTVIDFETANPCLDSICQIGIVKFEDEKIIQTWDVLVNPDDWFDPYNVSIHGITAEMVSEKPLFSGVYRELKEILENDVIVHHTAFDKTALHRVCEKYNLEMPVVKWLDSAKVVRRTWSQFKDRGYGLYPVSQFLNIEFKHHDALEDAIATGKILIAAIKESDICLDDWLNKIQQPITARNYAKAKDEIKQIGNPDGELSGEVLVFTGSFFMPKKDLSPIAASLGCDVDTTFTNRTTILVVGNQNEKALKGATKSSKHRAAEKRVLEGGQVRILSENDFIDIFNIHK